MKDLLDAIKTISKYNAMTFDEFILEYEKYYKSKIPERIKESYRFTGLNNINFIKTYWSIK